MMPKSVVRLSAGRESMSDELQALCFLAGANSIFLGDKLLTTPNAGDDRDSALFEKLGVYGWNHMAAESPWPGRTTAMGHHQRRKSTRLTSGPQCAPLKPAPA